MPKQPIKAVLENQKPDFSDDVHGHKRQIDKILAQAKLDLSAKNLEAFNHYADMNKTKKLASQRRSLYDSFCMLKQIGRDWDTITEKDMRAWWQTRINAYGDGKLGVESIRKQFWQAKKFFRWMAGLKKSRFPPCVDWMEWDADLKVDSNINPRDLPSQEDIKQLIFAAGGA